MFIILFLIVIFVLVLWAVAKSGNGSGHISYYGGFEDDFYHERTERSSKSKDPFSDPPEQDPEFASILEREFAEEDAMWDAVESGEFDCD